MKINEVEARVGITKKNIRFYEQEGLLHPQRNHENGYRYYSQQEVDMLMRIKLLRKLGLPLEEIRRMQAGQITVGDAMRRHLVTLEREQSNVAQAIALCKQLQDRQESLEALDADGLLEQMECMEQQGTTFHNKYRQDVCRRYIAPTVITVGMVVLMLVLTGLCVWGYIDQPEGAPPPALMAVFLLIPLAIIVGVLLALKQRWKELERGEEDEAKQY